MKVLVIDDEEGIRIVYEEFLGMLGHEADVAADGATGLALLQRHVYDLVITDVVMPGMSGVAFAEVMRQRYPDTPLIVISGSADRFDREKLRQAGYPLLQKPCSLTEFRHAITDHVSSSL